MMFKKSAVMLVVCLSMLSAVLAGELPEAPKFDSKVLAPTDEGRVKPVATKPEKPIKIAVLGLENNPFWIDVKRGTLDAAEELKDYDCQVDWIVPLGDAHNSNVFGVGIEDSKSQDYAAIAVIAGDSGIVPFIDRAVEEGIPVATFNVETVKPNKRLFFVGADLYEQGRVAADRLVDVVGKEGEVALVTGFFSVEGHEMRRQGFIDRLGEIAPGMKIVSQVETQDKDDAGYQYAQDFFTAYPELSAIVSFAGGSVGVGKAIEDQGLAGKVAFICYDYVPETIEQVRKGICSGTIGQNPYAQGHDPAIRLYNYLVGGVVPPAGRLLTRSDFVTKDNLAEFGF